MKSDQIDQLAKALAAAQGQMRGAAKAKTNPHFRSAYADLAAVVDAIRDALAANGIAVAQPTDYDGDGMWVSTTLMHASGQWIAGRYPVRPVKPDPQGYGSAVTYARRYALMAMTGIAAEDDDDDGNAASAPKSSAAAKRDGEWEKISAEIDAMASQAALRTWGATNRERIRALPEKWQEQVREYYDGRMAALRAQDAAALAAEP